MGAMEIALVISFIAIVAVAIIGVLILFVMVVQTVGGCYEVELLLFDCDGDEEEGGKEK